MNTNRWQANLHLGFSQRAGRSLLSHRQHHGPLVVQKTLYPEGEQSCHAIILHPPGGVAGGDQLRLQVDLDQHSHAVLSTPGAAKWYKANGATASQQLEFNIANHAILEWLPQETILYDAAQAQWQTRIQLDEQAIYAGWEINCLGRQARGESFNLGRLQQRAHIYRQQKLLWSDYTQLHGSDPRLCLQTGLASYPVFATFIIAAGKTPPALLENCRAVPHPENCRVGVTALPEIFIARYLGHHPIQAREYFEQLWQHLRPWYAKQQAKRLRIWNT